MLEHSKAFVVLKSENQKVLDFSKLLCYAVPNLKKAIKGYNEKVVNYESFIKPEYFIEPLRIENVTKLTVDYKENMSKYVLISIFSFLEAYFRDVVKELLEFHGGLETLIENMQKRQKGQIAAHLSSTVKDKRVLQTTYKKVKWQKYDKAIKRLDQDPNYRHPSELFSTYGVKTFFELINSGNFKSVMIPDLLEIGFGIDLSDKINQHVDLKDYTLKETFNVMRDMRNSIGHGNSSTISFEKVMDLIRFVRAFSVKIDNHLIKNYFIIEAIK